VGHEGKNAATLEAFYDELGDDRCAQLTAVSLDMGGVYKKATDVAPPRPANASTRFTS
jgi:transposase